MGKKTTYVGKRRRRKVDTYERQMMVAKVRGHNTETVRDTKIKPHVYVGDRIVFCVR